MTEQQASGHPSEGAPGATSQSFGGDAREANQAEVRRLAELRGVLRDALEAVHRRDWSKADTMLRSIAQFEIDSLNPEGVVRRATALRDSLDKQKRLRANRLMLIALCIAAGAVLATLLAIPVPTVRIVANVQTRAVAFDAVSPMSVSNLRASRVDLTGIQAARIDQRQKAASARALDRRGSALASSARAPSTGQRLRLRATGPFAQLSLTGRGLLLDSIEVASGASIVMESLVEPRHFRIQVSGAELAGTLSIGERLDVVTSDFSVEGGLAAGGSFGLADGALVAFEANSSKASFNVGVADDRSLPVARNLLVDQVRFSSRDIDRLESGILSGEVRLAEFNAAPIRLNPGDRLKLTAGASLQATSLTFEREFVIHLYGEVSSLELNSRSLKPSMLNWMRQHREAVLFVGALASMLSAVWLVMSRLELLRT